MRYRQLGRTGIAVSAIGLGTEHLLNVPREEAINVVHEAMDHGVNYFDVFYADARFRDTMGAAIKGRREKAVLTAHLGATVEAGQQAVSRDPKVAERYFYDYLKRYGTDYVDVLFLHNCDTQDDYDRIMETGGLIDLALRYREEGKTRCIAFSGHTTSAALPAVQDGRIEVLMYPINLASHAAPGKQNVLDACLTNQVGVVAMKPYAGGALLLQDGAMALNLWQTGAGEREVRRSVAITPVQCLSYVLAQTGVCLALPGCKSIGELHAAFAYLEASAEAKDFSAAVTDFEEYVTGECVYCNHCLPCPSVIDIGQINRLVDMARGGLTPALRAEYASLEVNAEDCVQCGICMERCPFGVDVIAKMEQAVQVYG